MGNVIYTGNNKTQTQNNSPVVLFDSGKITFNDTDYKWYDKNGNEITGTGLIRPYTIDDYGHSIATTGWYKNYWSGIKIPITVEKFLSYSEITITTLYTPRISDPFYLFLSSYENFQDRSGDLFLEVTLNNSSSSDNRYSVYQFINLGNGLFLSKNLLCNVGGTTGLEKTSKLNSIDNLKMEQIDSSGYPTFLYDLTNVNFSSSLFLKCFSPSRYSSIDKKAMVYPIGVGYEDLRIIITGR